MSVITLKPEELKRGDIIRPLSGPGRFIVREVSNGLVYTVEKSKDRKGPVLDLEGLAEYARVNIGSDNSDEYRETIIRRYLERHKNKTSALDAKSKYAKKRTETLAAYREMEKQIAGYAEQEGVSIIDYILLAAEFYEKNKDK